MANIPPLRINIPRQPSYFDSFTFDVERVNQDIIDSYGESKKNLSQADHFIINARLVALGYNVHANSVKNLFGYHKPGENICYIVIKDIRKEEGKEYTFGRIDLNEYSFLTIQKTPELLKIMQILGFVRKIEKNKIIFTKNGKILYQIEKRATSFGKVIFRRSSFKKSKT